MLTTQPYQQSLVHHGKVFDVRRLHPSTALLANGEFSDILVITGGLELHAYPDVKAVGTMELYGYYSPTVSANGTPLTPANRHYQNGHSQEVLSTFFHTPTITDVGTLIFTDIVPAGATQGASSSGGKLSFEDGFILGPNGVYLLRAKNVSGAAAIAHVAITAHEQKTND